MTRHELSETLFASGVVDAGVLAEMDRGGPCILAVSGGQDSMFLLYLFGELVERGFLKNRPIVFHLNHRLRAEAGSDLDFVAREARRLDFAFYFLERDAAKFARRTRSSPEEAGRVLRYRSLGRLRDARSPAGYAITAHHADDYLESVLLHFIRGAGPGAMSTLSFYSRVESVPVLRPLIALSRDRIARLVAERAIPFVEDPTNRSDRYLRNRLRHGPVAALRAEGLDAVKLWRNFHSDPRDDFAGPSRESGSPEGLDADQSRAPRAEYLSLDRRLLATPAPALSELKQLFDLALRRLGLPPADRDFLEEIRRQLRGRADYRMAYAGDGLRLWSDRRGPIWIMRQDAAALREPRFREAQPREDGRIAWEIRFNGRVRNYLLAPSESPAVFRPGLRAPLADGSRVQVRKLLREAGVPEPVRAGLPLILRESARGDLEVGAICYSFWESLRDRRFRKGA